MLNAISFVHIVIHGVKLYALCCTRGKALCSLLYIDRSVMLNAIQGLKLYAHCYTWCIALSSLLYME